MPQTGEEGPCFTVGNYLTSLSVYTALLTQVMWIHKVSLHNEKVKVLLFNHLDPYRLILVPGVMIMLQRNSDESVELIIVHFTVVIVIYSLVFYMKFLYIPHVKKQKQQENLHIIHKVIKKKKQKSL